METYINQLMEDLFDSMDKAEQTVNQWEDDIEGFMIDGVPYVNVDAAETVHAIIGIAEECFPPAHLLNESQMMGVNLALLDCLGLWNIRLIFPEKISGSVLYRSLTKALKNKIVLQHFGTVHIRLSLNDPETVRYFID
ncbi:hypothetical protein [uncultured Cytophaga sp.]|uniref:hypothetical protein n=1 Tax=uncultured Cytophaga sp. TaxID=160238 RepID=UPI00261CF6BB|nr:hypothetical protein [uncultured Cytophaga sp.]